MDTIRLNTQRKAAQNNTFQLVDLFVIGEGTGNSEVIFLCILGLNK